jgi:uroporphyrinogen decarboxylase
MLPKQRYLETLAGRPHDRVPVTPIFMAWAAHGIGRTYRDYYLDGDVLVEAQLALAKAFGVDQVSAISDPWRESSAYGMQFDYPPESVGTPLRKLLLSPADIAGLGPLNFSAAPRTAQRIDSVSKLAAALGATHSVLGWVEGPLAQYADLRGLEQAMVDLLDQPELFHRAADTITANAADFASLQLQAGAETIGVGDAAASLVGPELYRQHVLPWERKLVAAIHDSGGLVKLHICGNTHGILNDMAATGADVLDLDWMVHLGDARRSLGRNVCLCGNFDPSAVLLAGTPADVAAAARVCIAHAGGPAARFILQPGCEVPPGTAEANLRAFCPAEGCLIAQALACGR